MPTKDDVQAAFERLENDLKALQSAIEVRAWPYIEPAFVRLSKSLENERAKLIDAALDKYVEDRGVLKPNPAVEKKEPTRAPQKRKKPKSRK